MKNKSEKIYIKCRICGNLVQLDKLNTHSNLCQQNEEIRKKIKKIDEDLSLFIEKIEKQRNYFNHESNIQFKILIFKKKRKKKLTEKKLFVKKNQKFQINLIWFNLPQKTTLNQ